MGPKLRELEPAARGSQDAGSRNLWPSLLSIPVYGTELKSLRFVSLPSLYGEPRWEENANALDSGGASTIHWFPKPFAEQVVLL